MDFGSNLVTADTCKFAAICIGNPMRQLRLRLVLASHFAKHANGSLANHRPHLAHRLKVLVKFGAPAALAIGLTRIPGFWLAIAVIGIAVMTLVPMAVVRIAVAAVRVHSLVAIAVVSVAEAAVLCVPCVFDLGSAGLEAVSVVLVVVIGSEGSPDGLFKAVVVAIALTFQPFLKAPIDAGAGTRARYAAASGAGLDRQTALGLIRATALTRHDADRYG